MPAKHKKPGEEDELDPDTMDALTDTDADLDEEEDLEEEAYEEESDEDF